MKSVHFLSQSVSRRPRFWTAQKAAIRRAIRALPIAFACVATFQGGLVHAGGPTLDSSNLPTPGPYQIPDPCRDAMPHTTFAVPLNFGSKVIPSGGGYYYRANQNNGCDRWVMDIYMAVYASKGPLIDGQWFGPGAVMLDGGPYDLPSSSFYEGARPVTREDCERVSDSVIIYRKLATESQFTRVDYTSSKGKWMNNHCEFGMTNFFPSGYYKAPAGPMGGVDTYRVAVKVKERSSAQEAVVVISQPSPD